MQLKKASIRGLNQQRWPVKPGGPSRLYRIAAASTFSLISILGAQQQLQTCVCGGHSSPPTPTPSSFFFSFGKVTFTHMLVHLKTVVEGAGKAGKNTQIHARSNDRKAGAAYK